jgi:predicted phage terminase large subunit-like protein
MLLCCPQHGKSTIASKRFPAYMLGRNPRLDIISASATAMLAGEFGGEVRDCVASPEFRGIFGDVALKADSQAKDRWRTDKGGGYYAVGIGGALFGRGAGLGIIDDPFATWEDAQSDLQRRRVWSWYQGTFYNRIRPGGAIVIIQHRMHEDDLVGRLLAEERNGGADKWTVVNLPADLDDPPWPERYDRAALQRIKDNTDPRQWSALYMQDPTPEDGTFFRAEWVKHWDSRSLPALHKYGTSDYAVTDDGGDYTVHRVWGVAANGDVYRLDGWRGQTTANVWIEKKLDLIKRHEPFAWFGESGVIRKAIEPMLIQRMRERDIYCRMEWLPSISDKPTRARGFQARMAAGRVYFEPGADLAEHLKFPAGRHDDDVDCSGLLGRCLDSAHPAVVPPKPSDRPGYDAWEKAFAKDDEDEQSYKTV